MDGTRFDGFTRSLTTINSRREAVKALTVAGLGLGLMQAGDTEAKKKRKKRCKRLLATCHPEGKRKCCNDLTCSTRGQGFHCRKGVGQPCASADECESILLCLDGTCKVFIPPIT